MTTSTLIGPCTGERCEKCGDERGSDRHSVIYQAMREPPAFSHEFVEHVHTIECSARFYREVFGCDVRFHAHWICYRHEHHGVPQPSNDRHFITDIMGDPSSAEAWLAMRDVLAEIERRDWTAIIETASTPGDFNVILLGGDDGPNCPPLATVHNEPAPRAVALAAWAASSSSEALAEGD